MAKVGHSLENNRKTDTRWRATRAKTFANSVFKWKRSNIARYEKMFQRKVSYGGKLYAVLFIYFTNDCENRLKIFNWRLQYSIADSVTGKNCVM